MAQNSTHPRKGVRKKYQIELSSFSLLLWGLCALFFMGWMFVLGVLVGRGFLPGAESALGNLKTQVARLQEVAARSKRGEPGSQKKETIDETLGFYERLEGKKEEVQKDRDLSNTVDGAKREVLEKTGGEPSKQDIRPEEERPKPAGLGERLIAAQASKGAYTLQVASLEERAKADKMVGNLISKGYDAYFYEVHVKGKIYYRVRCGRFMTREEAKDCAAQLFKTLSIRGFVSKFE
ncbi:MAG: SPOR domain-containing protein [Deltaproteobacteria bacterium]|nr:SPOR domain-containing protein [Deltaproteobacteria bacterium]